MVSSRSSSVIRWYSRANSRASRCSWSSSSSASSRIASRSSVEVLVDELQLGDRFS